MAGYNAHSQYKSRTVFGTMGLTQTTNVNSVPYLNHCWFIVPLLTKYQFLQLALVKESPVSNSSQSLLFFLLYTAYSKGLLFLLNLIFSVSCFKKCVHLSSIIAELMLLKLLYKSPQIVDVVNLYP